MRRRELLLAAAALGLPTWRPRPPRAATRLILLGTAGGPRPKPGRNAAAQVILVGDTPYLIDCGNGVARQLVLAGVPLRTLHHVFVTHHHSDHNADFGTLLLLAWSSGLAEPVDAWGPPPLAEITRLFLEMSRRDIEVRIADEGRVPLAPLVRPHELAGPGPVYEDANVRVTSALVPHPMMTPAYAYRFDTADRSIVISGDTAPSDAVVALAQGADVLVHEAMYLPAVDRIVSGVGDANATTLRRHLVDSHTSAEDAGRIARRAGVGTLVLSHLIPSDDPAVTEAMWRAAAESTFGGRVVVGRDLMEL